MTSLVYLFSYEDIFDGSKGHENYFGYGDPPKDDIIRLCPLAPLQNKGPFTYTASTPAWGSQTVSGHGKGIKCVAETLEHERHHFALYKAFHSQIAANGKIDPDGDGIPSTAESTTDNIRSDPTNPDTFNLAGSMPIYAAYADQEIRCRKKELNLTIAYHPEKDWAEPGCQSQPPYGP